MKGSRSKVKNVEELFIENSNVNIFEEEKTSIHGFNTPAKINKPKGSRRAATTSRKLIQKQDQVTDIATKQEVPSKTNNRTTVKKSETELKKALPDNQTRIDSYFKSSTKSHTIDTRKDIQRTEVQRECGSSSTIVSKNKTNRSSTKTKQKSRKRLFEKNMSTTTESMSFSSVTKSTKPKTKVGKKRKPLRKTETNEITTTRTKLSIECINLCSDSEDAFDFTLTAQNQKFVNGNSKENCVEDSIVKIKHQRYSSQSSNLSISKASLPSKSKKRFTKLTSEASTSTFYMPNKNNLFNGRTNDTLKSPCDSTKSTNKPVVSRTPALSISYSVEDSSDDVASDHIPKAEVTSSKKRRSCSPYKVVAGATFELNNSFTKRQENTLDSTKKEIRSLKTSRVSMETATSSSHNAQKTNDEDISSNTVTAPGRKRRPCPPYKKVAGTTFAVDAFQYGTIEGVTHYFLTHYHADHYVGLTRKFAMPLYLSSITASLVRTFIPIAEEYLHELKMNEPIDISGVEVTAIDANHCPGAVMLLFKLPCGKRILHTGDFRASFEMESQPIFWNNDIHTIYLDTTYISDKYAFCTQHESIDEGKAIVLKFQEKHAGKRILYVCGSYVIGKEKFWSALACEFDLKVWTEGNRLKALNAIDNSEIGNLMCDNPIEANLHILGIGVLNYMSLYQYFQSYKSHYDVLLAFRPSGWEKNSRPQYRGTINIVGVEYSEHSSYNELERFVRYIKPEEVISTVPVGRDPMVCGKVPPKWYLDKRSRVGRRNFQTSITSYMQLHSKKTTDKENRTSDRLSLSEVQISPFKSTSKSQHDTENRTPSIKGLQAIEKTSPVKAVKRLSLNDIPKAIENQCENTTAFPITKDLDAEDDWIS